MFHQVARQVRQRALSGGLAHVRVLSARASGGSSSGDAPKVPGWMRIAASGLGATTLALGLGLSVGCLPAEAETAAYKGKGNEASFTKEEVAKHKTRDSVWVTYKGNVYDITKFVAMHPGGAQKIMLSAGGSVEPFWAMYQQHQKAEVQEILAPYRIGKLEGWSAASAPALADPYMKEPERHPALVELQNKPYNAETPGHLLGTSMITPTDIFFVRNHLPVPEVDMCKYKLVIEGEGLRSMEFTLDELKAKFKKYTITASQQCSGNRRAELKSFKDIKGLSWTIGAMGCATWGGVRLRDVLMAGGLSEEDSSVAHIHLVGLDTDPTTGTVYAASIPAHKATSFAGDVLLAFEMNGEPLSRDHGYPLRAVVPGTTGARNVKWLSKVVASSVESDSHWQQKDYKIFSPQVDWDTVDWNSAPAMQDTAITSAIAEPDSNAEVYLADGEVTVRGYAWAGGGRDVIRVEVTTDNGKTWEVAALKKTPQPAGRAWAWTLWEVTVPFPKGTKAGDEVQLACRAVDSSCNSQPSDMESLWNLRGLANNAWHRVTFKVL